jgi:hemophore-related protein
MVFSIGPRSAVVVGVLALSLSFGTGHASAEPIYAPLINTTCSYAQVTAALQVEAPDLASLLGVYPQAQTKLRQFLALPAAQREAKIQQGLAVNPQWQTTLDSKSSTPEGQQQIEQITQVANTCQNY